MKIIGPFQINSFRGREGGGYTPSSRAGGGGGGVGKSNGQMDKKRGGGGGLKVLTLLEWVGHQRFPPFKKGMGGGGGTREFCAWAGAISPFCTPVPVIDDGSV